MDENHSAPSARTKKLNKGRPSSLKTDSFNETVNGIEKHADNGINGDRNADSLKITFREVSYSISEGFIRRSKYLSKAITTTLNIFILLANKTQCSFR